MNYSAQKLAKALVEIALENPSDTQKAAKNFLSFCEKSKLNYLLPSVIRYLEIELGRQERKNTFKIFSTVKPSEEVIKKIKKIAGAEPSCPVEVVEDKEIGAGFVAHYQNKTIDGSLDNNLRLLKNKIING